jgi:hypothetical protein
VARDLSVGLLTDCWINTSTPSSLSTLNIATGVLVVALLTERYDELGCIALAVWCFAASVVVALGGMDAVLSELRRDTPQPVSHRLLRTLHYASVTLLAAGLGLSLWQAF